MKFIQGALKRLIFDHLLDVFIIKLNFDDVLQKDPQQVRSNVSTLFLSNLFRNWFCFLSLF